MSRHARSTGINPVSIYTHPIELVGCGGIGSWLARLLAQMGFSRVRLWDPDEVELANIGGQCYAPGDVGTAKARALAPDPSWSGGQPEARIELVGADTALWPGAIVIPAVDSLAARGAIWRACRASKVRAVVDPRMGGEAGMVYSVPMDDPVARSGYGKTLHGKPHAEPCNAKATAYAGAIVASLAAHRVAALARGDHPPFCVRFDLDIGGEGWRVERLDKGGR